MITQAFTQADLGAGPSVLFSSMSGGMYLIRIVAKTSAISGGGGAPRYTFNWVESDGVAGSMFNGLDLVPVRYAHDLILTLDDPSDFTVTLTAQGFSGTMAGSFDVFVTRLREEGC